MCRVIVLHLYDLDFDLRVKYQLRMGIFMSNLKFCSKVHYHKMIFIYQYCPFITLPFDLKVDYYFFKFNCRLSTVNFLKKSFTYFVLKWKVCIQIKQMIGPGPSRNGSHRNCIWFAPWSRTPSKMIVISRHSFNIGSCGESVIKIRTLWRKHYQNSPMKLVNHCKAWMVFWNYVHWFQPPSKVNILSEMF